MSSDWEAREDAGLVWYENIITGETAWDIPGPDIGSIVPSEGGYSGYAASSDDAWQEDTTGYQWDETAQEWVIEENWDPSTQTGLYDFTQGYYGEDGMWYDDDNQPPSPQASTEPEPISNALAIENYVNNDDYGDMEVDVAAKSGYYDEATGLYYSGYWGDDGEWHEAAADPTNSAEIEEEAYMDASGHYYDTTGYWGDDGEWHDGIDEEANRDIEAEPEPEPEEDDYLDPSGNQYDTNGYWGDDGEWHDGEDPGVNTNESGYVDENGNFYNQSGYWGDDGEWHEAEGSVDGDGEHAYMDASGNYYDVSGYWGDDGEWHEAEASEQGELAYMDADGNYYDAGGYYDEEGEWHEYPLDDADAYMDANGNYYDTTGYWGDDGEWHEGPHAMIEAPKPDVGRVVITVLSASGLHLFRLMEIEDSYEMPSIASLVDKCKPYVAVIRCYFMLVFHSNVIFICLFVVEDI